jgi:hypothetical protein
MASASQEFQKALFAAMTGSADIVALVGPEIYDGVPPATADFPRITFGAADMVPQQLDCVNAHLETLQIDVWSRRNGELYEAKAIVNAIEALLNGADLSLATHAVSAVEITLIRVFQDRDVSTAHGVVQVEAMVERIDP